MVNEFREDKPRRLLPRPVGKPRVTSGSRTALTPGQVDIDKHSGLCQGPYSRAKIGHLRRVFCHPHTGRIKVAPSPFRRRPTAHNSTSLLRFLFPNTRERARAQLSKLRYELLPYLRHRAQSRIYRYIVHRQLLKQRRNKLGGVLGLLRGRGRGLIGSGSAVKNVGNSGRSRMSARGLFGSSSSEYTGAGTQDGLQSDSRQPGAKRKKFAGYLRVANELRQSYVGSYSSSWTRKDQNGLDFDEGTPGAFPDAAIVRSGEEEMILFPSYARRHVKSKVLSYITLKSIIPC